MEKLKSFPFMEKRKIYYIVTLVLIIASIATGLIRGYNFGIDFTGGTLMQIEMGKEVKISEINDILSDQKIDGNVTHAGDGNTQIIIKTTDSMESDTRTALMSALEEKYGVTDDAVLSIENIGPSVGETLKSSAFKATAIAIVLMLIYIAVRFMWKYGIAAIIALANTVLLVIGFYGVFHISINSPFIAAILTILGYGINDTIVIFDRIRELERTPSAPLDDKDLANKAIANTLTRSLLTTLTTLVMIVSLAIFGISTIREFALPIIFGLVAGTYSSVLLSASTWVYLRKLFKQSNKRPAVKVKKIENTATEAEGI